MASTRKPPVDDDPGAPEWMVTFSDCMTLLLTFFVLLLSFSSFDDKIYKQFYETVFTDLPYLFQEVKRSRDAMTDVERAERYSYIYEGVSQLIDHILATPSLAEHLAWAQSVHVNADYPLPLPETEDPHRSSDHDPVIAVFQFGE